MPGIVVFRRRWSVGSDDLVVPGAFLFTVHLIWAIILSVLIGFAKFTQIERCELQLLSIVAGYLIILILSMLTEICICIVAMRGSILDTAPRASMQYILYIRVAIMVIEAAWLSLSIAWHLKNYLTCPIANALQPRETALAMTVANVCILLSVLITVWCTYDTAGRSWVKMKQYQRSMRTHESKYQYKRSNSTRNWRQRKVLRAYQDSWHNRCRFLMCCSTPSDRNRNSFADIARLLSDFFRDLDVVPSDVVAGLVLLRKFQKIERKAIVERRKNETYEFLSGVAVTPQTQFLSLSEHGTDLTLFQSVIHYAHFAVRAYGWPIYLMTSTFGLCKLCTGCCCMKTPTGEVVDDNCCNCNYATLLKLTQLGDIEIIYATYHVDVGETPFFVALDYDRKKVVISVRGTLSMKDILTDLNAEGETLPLHPPKDDWLGHKGMVQAANYIYQKIEEESLIERALNYAPDRGTPDFRLVIVGHSLGAGTASILGILLRQRYATLKCYCYSPPGGLLSMPAVEYTKAFTVSVVVGKDVVPRIGLHQMEALRADLINAIKRSVDPKWKTITCSIVCCGCGSQPTSAVELSTGESDVGEYMRAKESARCEGIHPSDSTIALTSHQPLYPPGRIIHVVRHHPTRGEQAFSKNEPVYQALWAGNTDFDEVLISPVMIQDHMPDQVLDALNKVVTAQGPRKPQRLREPPPPSPRLHLETSFTSLAAPPANGRAHRPRAAPPDLIHDDWFGLAPLASPESLSEVSSISSGMALMLAAGHVSTPTIMRRSLKISGGLSTCADDAANVRDFRNAVVFRTMSGAPSAGSSRSSYESAESVRATVVEESDDFQSAEDILDNVLVSAGCKEYFSSESEILETHFDGFVEDEPLVRNRTSATSTPQEDFDPDAILNYAIDLNLADHHRSAQFHHRATADSKPASSIDSGSICRTPSEPKNVTFNPQVIAISDACAPPAAAPPKWNIFRRANNHTPLSCTTSSSDGSAAAAPPHPPKTILSVKGGRGGGVEAETASSPLLNTLNERTIGTPPGFVRRKSYVYPMERGGSGGFHSESSV